MGQDDLLGVCERSQQLSRALVGEMIEAAAQHLAVEGDTPASFTVMAGQQPLAVGAKGRFQRRGVELMQHIAHGGIRRRSFPGTAKHRNDPPPVGYQEAMHLAIRGGATGNRQNGADEQRGQLIATPLGTPRIGHLLEALLQCHKDSPHGSSSEPYSTGAEN